ncbi:Hypothetical predicted protein [Cloeon dipterum]|uniref:Uncharacterized protein n=1 Tax=Cloeon dipterum TaxID=197152 RepID=A0A8S1DU41_9INSE|nr:Hypothetical predicted protein [Cloeon dipterum]
MDCCPDLFKLSSWTRLFHHYIFYLWKFTVVGGLCLIVLFGLSFLPSQQPEKEEVPSEEEEEEEEEDVYEQKCVYCRNLFWRAGNSELLAKNVAELVPQMCPIHFNQHCRRKFFRKPQDPLTICPSCSEDFSFYQQQCFFTSDINFYKDFCRQHLQLVHFWRFHSKIIDNMHWCRELNSCNPRAVLRGVLAGLSWMVSSFYPRCPPSPPKPKVKRKKCVYCRDRIERKSDSELLTPEEAKLVPQLCHHHFHIGRPRIYRKEPYEPDQICDSCTDIFRLNQPECFSTSKAEPRFLNKELCNGRRMDEESERDRLLELLNMERSNELEFDGIIIL